MEQKLFEEFLTRDEIKRLFRLRREALGFQHVLARMSDVCGRLVNLKLLREPVYPLQKVGLAMAAGDARSGQHLLTALAASHGVGADIGQPAPFECGTRRWSKPMIENPIPKNGLEALLTPEECVLWKEKAK